MIVKTISWRLQRDDDALLAWKILPVRIKKKDHVEAVCC
jgi:hypothetical protein